MPVITVERKVMEKNDEVAAELRRHFESRNIHVLNLLSSPGSGKTTLLERTLERIQNTVKVAVIEGDVQTDNDAQRIAEYSIPVVQIVTRGGCHLDALLVRDALSKLDHQKAQLLFIENVGNLVCPAGYDLGEHQKVVIVSTTEGEDKPAKYPKMFHVADVCILNKIDLLPHLDFNVDRFYNNAKKVNPNLTFFECSAKTGQGLDMWIEWLLARIQ